jgi:cytochrome b561
MKGTHDVLATILYVIVGLHVLGALKHHFFLKDDVLRRMLPFTKKT